MKKHHSGYFYGIRIKRSDGWTFLARKNASAPNLFWFHEDAVKWRKKCMVKHRSNPDDIVVKGVDIVKVFVRWNENGGVYNESGNLFRSAKELKSKINKKGN